MKVKELTRRMNDFGTKPRVKVVKHTSDCSLLVYEGKPSNIDDEVKNLSVNTFTVLGTGFIEIHV